jgi:hypothetical protein
MKFLTISILFITISLASAAQQADSVTYHLSFSGTGNVNNTNDGTSYIFNNALKFNINSRILSINTFNSWIYGQNPTSKTNNDFLSVADFDLFKNIHRWYYWALAGFEKSYSLKIDNRIQAGGGIGLNIIKKPAVSLVITDGILYEKSRLAEADIYQRDHYETIRNSLRIKYRVVVKNIFSIEGTNFLQNSLADKEDYIIRSATNLSFHLKKWLSLTMAVNYNKLNLSGRENFLFNYGLMIEKIF